MTINYNNIKISIFDLDGTLTDGIYQVNSEGITTKSFYTRDFSALEQLLKNNIKIIIISQSNDLCVWQRINNIRTKTRSDIWKDAFDKRRIILFQGIDNKRSHIEQLVLPLFGCYGKTFSWHQVAYMGDAENDIECMKKAHYTGCPSDAIEEVKENSNYVSNYSGGKGCVYDFVMHILRERDKNGNSKS
ncbi:hypothetical protein LCGC14_0829790 [marine sediment metagenome]|uniref:3-deoxy-D-manno-octulosonate 8-phosphate phosphatase n=1 Tax=marine sediment metagenome TaxID=412755 RepID=A0A0F9PL22_9ZZZZ